MISFFDVDLPKVVMVVLIAYLIFLFIVAGYGFNLRFFLIRHFQHLHSLLNLQDSLLKLLDQ